MEVALDGDSFLEDRSAGITDGQKKHKQVSCVSGEPPDSWATFRRGHAYRPTRRNRRAAYVHHVDAGLQDVDLGLRLVVEPGGDRQQTRPPLP